MRNKIRVYKNNKQSLETIQNTTEIHVPMNEYIAYNLPYTMLRIATKQLSTKAVVNWVGN